MSTSSPASTEAVLFSVIEYLQSLKAQGANSDSIDTITGLIEDEFPALKGEAEAFRAFSYYPTSLPDIFAAGVTSLPAKCFSDSLADAESNPKFESFVDVVKAKGFFDGAEEGSVEFLKRQAKLISKFQLKAAATSAADGKSNTTGAASGISTEEAEAQAEDFKFKGNAAINAKDYEEAVRCYTAALELSSEGPNSHVYHSNRAAAYCHLNKYQEAVDDCHLCLAMQSDYVKAYSRLGLANFFLGNYEESVDAYEKAVELEPDSKASQDSLRQAKNKLKKYKAANSPSSSVSSSAAADPFAGAGLGALPPGLMNNPGMKAALDQVGGAGGLANLMKDPTMQAMAQQMMKDPAAMQRAMAMMGGGGGGMPDMSALAGMMGGLGGAADATAVADGVAPSSSSKSKAKAPFKGFED